MVKLLAICLGVVCAMGVNKYNNVQDAIMNADMVNICYSNKEYNIVKDSFQYDLCMNFIENILDCSHQLPALGVAIDKEVIEEKKNKDWVEFSFNKICDIDGMFFDALLIFLEKDMGGVNVFRKVDGKYDGRCYYINLQNNFNNIL